MARGGAAPGGTAPHYDLVIIGAGISGIAGAYFFKKRHPTKTLLVLEARDSIGGTWDFFKYPGVRCDSPIYTFGFSFRPWLGDRKFPEAGDIKEHFEDTLREFDIHRHVRFGTRVTRAEIDTLNAGDRRPAWRLEAADGSRFTASFVYMCGGYYKYDAGYSPEVPRRQHFEGAAGADNVIVHAQAWDGSVDYRGRNVAIVGSGATAITMLPSMVKGGARQVVMVQRSPTYVFSDSNQRDGCVGFLPYSMIRRGHMNRTRALYNRCRLFPRLSRWALLRKVLGSLPDDDAELNRARAPSAPSRTPRQVLDEHFSPSYAPFDQRVCVMPDGDFFNAMRAIGTTSPQGGDARAPEDFRRAVVVTGHIDSFTGTGLRMKPGAKLSSPLATRDGAAVVDAGEGEAVEVPCEVCVLATGFNLQTNYPMGDMRVVVDGVEYSAREHFVYKSCMLSDVPNFFFCLGYVNNSWTIKSEMVGAYVSDFIAHLDARGAHTLVARPGRALEGAELDCMLPLAAGYVNRHRDTLPKVLPPASGSPWVAPHDYKLDMKLLSRPGDSADRKFVHFA